MKFHATSLADIAKHFRDNAQQTRDRATKTPERSQQRKVLQVEAYTWERAAVMIEMTELAAPGRKRPKVTE